MPSASWAEWLRAFRGTSSSGYMDWVAGAAGFGLYGVEFEVHLFGFGMSLGICRDLKVWVCRRISAQSV